MEATPDIRTKSSIMKGRSLSILPYHEVICDKHKYLEKRGIDHIVVVSRRSTIETLPLAGVAIEPFHCTMSSMYLKNMSYAKNMQNILPLIKTRNFLTFRTRTHAAKISPKNFKALVKRRQKKHG